MAGGATDDYALLDSVSTATDEELHAAYRAQLKLHHPDRHGGSAEATRRSQEIGAAYERLLAARRAGPTPPPPPSAPRSATRPGPAPPPPSDPETERRIAAMEAQVRAQAARAAKEAAAERDRAKAAAMAAAAEALGQTPHVPDGGAEEDSLGRIFADTVADLKDRAHPAVERAQRLFDALDRFGDRPGDEDRGPRDRR